MNYDVIVVGAGPAGGILAYQLALNGVRVLILERQTLPRYKPCGGGVTLKTIQSIPFDISPVLERRVVGGILCYANRPLHKVELEQPVAWTVMRDRFDNYILKQALAAGADLIDGIHVRGVEQDEKSVWVNTSQGVFSSLLLTGADGVNSKIARTAGLLDNRRTGVAIEAELDVPVAAYEAQGMFATFDFGLFPGGYAWIFPKQGHLSAGVFQANTSKASKLREYLENFIQNQSVLKDYHGLNQHGHRIPLGGASKQLHNGRVLLIGDAANLADPWLGEGIYYAIFSAFAAADVLIDFLEGKIGDLSVYTHHINRQLIPQFREAQRLANFVYRFPKICTRALSHSPYVFKSLFTMLRGEMDFKQFTLGLIMRSPQIFYEMMSG